MAADALAPCVTRTSTAMVLNMQYKQILVFNEEGFQQPAPSQCWKIIENANIFLTFIKIHSGRQGLVFIDPQQMA